MKFANIMFMKDFLIYITFIAVLGFSATAPATQSFDLSVFDKKQVKIEEFTENNEEVSRLSDDDLRTTDNEEVIQLNETSSCRD